MNSNNDRERLENEEKSDSTTEIQTAGVNEETKDNETTEQINHSTPDQKVDANNNILSENNKAIIVTENPIISLIPSAYSMRVISSVYPQTSLINQPSYHSTLIESNAQPTPQPAAQWHNEQIPQSTAYLAAPAQSFITNQQPTNLPAQIQTIYPIDSNAEHISYDPYGHYHSNLAYGYPNAYPSPIHMPHSWSTHAVNTTPNMAYSYPQESSNQTSAPHSTPTSSANSSNKSHLIAYDYSKEKARQPTSSNMYHYVSNEYTQANTNNLAQHTTDNVNSGFLPFNMYANASSQRRIKSNNNNISIKLNGNKSNDLKHKTDNKRPNKKYQKTEEINAYHYQQQYQHQNGKKRYSEIANNNTNKNQLAKTNETSSSASPTTGAQFNLDNDYQREYSHHLTEYNNYPNFYNMPYNQLPYYNQYHKECKFENYSRAIKFNFNLFNVVVNYAKPSPYYTATYHHDAPSLEHDMANLSLYGYYPIPYAEPNQHMNNMNANSKADPYDPKEFYVSGEREGIKKSKFFVIKSYSKNDIIHCIDYSVWCSTPEGNKKLDKAFQECANESCASVYLFFSINGSGQFCGMAQMMSRVDYESKFEIWSQDKWKGKFDVHWIYVKDVPNTKLRHILLANNENKPVTNSRDTQEVFYDDAIRVLDVFRQHVKKSSILDEKSSKFLSNYTNSTSITANTTNEVNRFNLDEKKNFN